MADIDNVINELVSHIESALAVDSDYVDCVRTDTLQTVVGLLKEQQPKHGHWIEQEGFDGDVYYDCSVCGESWVTVEGTPEDNGMICCPHCGAKMDEPKAGEQE